MAKAALHHRIETPDPVAFITIDDGYALDAQAAAYVAAQALPVTNFFTYYAVTGHAEEMRAFCTGVGAQRRVGCHHKQHIDYRGQSEAAQQTALANAADWLAEPGMFAYGRPTLFRPPYGQYDVATLTAAYNAGLPHLVLWTHEWDGSAFVGTWGTPRLRPGDILLCHHPSQSGMDGYLLTQLLVAQAMIAGANLAPAYLYDYLGV